MTTDKRGQYLHKLKDAFFYAVTRSIDLQDYFTKNPYRFAYALSSAVNDWEMYESEGVPDSSHIKTQIEQLFTEYRTDIQWLMQFQAVPSAPTPPSQGIYTTQKSG